MSDQEENFENMENNEIQYVLDDSQLILDQENIKSELGDIVLQEGTMAYILEENSNENAFIWQDQDLNYYINDENGQFKLISNEELNENSTILENSEVIQLNEHEANISENSNILYLDETNFSNLTNDDNTDINYEPNENATFLQTITLQNNDCDEETSQIRYAIIKDGQFQIETYNPSEVALVDIDTSQNDDDNNQNCQNNDGNTEKTVNVASATGKNLMTGQQLHLNTYLDRIEKRNNEKNDFLVSMKNLVNKKLKLGETDDGKVLVGRITSVKKKVETENEIINNENGEAAIVDEDNCNNIESEDASREGIDNNISNLKTIFISKSKKVLTHEKIVSKECFEHISKTLSGLMNMESVRKKIQQKSMVVKVVEKNNRITNHEKNKNISFCSGFMIEEYSINENNEISQGWRFILDKNMKDAIFGKNTDDEIDYGDIRYTEAINITLNISYDDNGEKHIQVFFNSKSDRQCLVCNKTFTNSIQLTHHQKSCHRYLILECKICGEKFTEENVFEVHKKSHINNYTHTVNTFDCTNCTKKFDSVGKLRRHMSTHYQRYGCENCKKSFSSEEELEAHRSTHKLYDCETCGKRFSRQSNLARHIEIHKGSKTEYTCSVCGCSYHFHSSLTRHIVQNHMTILNENKTQMIVIEK